MNDDELRLEHLKLESETIKLDILIKSIHAVDNLCRTLSRFDSEALSIEQSKKIRAKITSILESM